jgi:hypothetical protein
MRGSAYSIVIFANMIWHDALSGLPNDLERYGMVLPECGLNKLSFCSHQLDFHRWLYIVGKWRACWSELRNIQAGQETNIVVYHSLVIRR